MRLGRRNRMLLTNDIGGLFGERIERIRWRKCFLLTGLLLSIICGAKRPIHADETEPIMKSSDTDHVEHANDQTKVWEEICLSDGKMAMQIQKECVSPPRCASIPNRTLNLKPSGI